MANFKQKLSGKMQALQWNARLNSNEYTQRRMTFGKYTNKMISELPIDYVKWGTLNLDSEWSMYFARELQRRDPEYGKMGSVWR